MYAWNTALNMTPVLFAVFAFFLFTIFYRPKNNADPDGNMHIFNISVFFILIAIFTALMNIVVKLSAIYDKLSLLTK